MEQILGIKKMLFAHYLFSFFWEMKCIYFLQNYVRRTGGATQEIALSTKNHTL